MNENILMPTLHGACELTHWGLACARGRDAASFLHGQLSNDVTSLDVTQTRLAAYCSPKGRMLASFLIWRAGPDEVWLACHRSVLETAVRRLSMFVLRADCNLSIHSASDTEVPRLWGVVGPSADAALESAGGVKLWGRGVASDGSTVLHLPAADAVTRALIFGRRPADASPLALETWQTLEVLSGIPMIESSTADQFVPQMINFELLGGINFKKGCYPGQEVVARSQYRGTTKRRMFLFEVDAEANSGQEIFHPEDPGQPAGQVVNSAARLQGAGSVVLAEVKLAALKGPALRLGRLDGPELRPLALPYEVPTDAGAEA